MVSFPGQLKLSSIPLYESTDLQTITLKRTYNPSAVDSRYDYCHLWAPDLSKRNGAELRGGP